MKSIQARLWLGLGIALVVLFLLQWAVVNYTIRHSTNEIFQTRLEQDSDSIIAALVVLDSGKISLPFASVSDVYQHPFSGHYYRIDSPVNSLRSRSLWDRDLKIEKFKMELGKIYFHRIIGPLNQPLLVYGITVKKRGKVITIHVAHDVTDLENDMFGLQVTYGTISLSAFLILLILQTAIIRKGLSPITKAQQQLQAMQRGEVKALNEDAPSEVKPLVLEINRLVNLLSQRIQRSRNALGNLAHALKAPLTVMTNTANSEEMKKLTPNPHKVILQQSQYMRELVERELKRARLAGVSEPGKYFNVSKDTEPLITMLESIYRSKDLALDINVPENISCPLDREDMMELIGNLLDNACKNAKNLVSFTAVVTDRLTIRVEDDGPGVPEDKINELLKRGTRIDESTLGHGLGLSIVKDAVDHYHGRLEMGRSQKYGGFMIMISLPFGKET